MTPLLVESAALCGAGLLAGGAVVVRTRNAELVSRWLVWLVACPLVLGAAVLPAGFGWLATALGLVAGLELARLLAAGRSITARVAVLAGCLAPTLCAVAGSTSARPWLVLLALTVPVAPALVGRLGERPSAPVPAAVATALVGLPLAVLATAPERWVLPTVVSVCFADVAGYVFGKLLGRNGFLAEPISRWSPNKTRAGLLGSMIVGGAVLIALHAWWLAPLVPLWGVLGDLRESRIKRLAGVKDAGTWLPGFGGLLDRVDSTLGAMVGVAVSVVAVSVGTALVGALS